MSKSTRFAAILGLSLLAFATAPEARAASIFGFGHAETASPAVHARHSSRQFATRARHDRLSRRAAVRVSGRPRAWCGWWLGRHLGLYDRSLWLARNWAHVGSPTHARPGAVVVWLGHVGKVTAVAGNKIRVLSGNSGRNHAVTNHWRSMRGVIAFRSV